MVTTAVDLSKTFLLSLQQPEEEREDAALKLSCTVHIHFGAQKRRDCIRNAVISL